MKKIVASHQQLPSIGPFSSRKSSQSRDSVKVLETKVSKHESSIQRNQKVIISIANDFKLVKEELAIKQKEHEQLTEMYGKIVEENKKMIKSFKEMKAFVARLEKIIEEKDQVIQQAKSEEPEKIAHKQNQIEELKLQISSMAKSNRILEKANQELMNQHQKNKEQIIKIKKKNLELEQSLYKNTGAEERSRSFAQIIDSLTAEKDRLSRQLADRDDEIKKSRDSEKIKQKILRDNKKLEEQLNILRANNEKLVEDHKKRKEKVVELEALVKSIQEKQLSESSQQSRLTQLLEAQEKLISQVGILKEKERQLMMEVRELASEVQEKKKLETKVKKVQKSRADLKSISQQIQKIIKCEYCQKQLNKPVTSIPCGHSFCMECKKGYEKECKKCPNFVKRQAVYRNQLLDDMIMGVTKIEQAVTLINNLE